MNGVACVWLELSRFEHGAASCSFLGRPLEFASFVRALFASFLAEAGRNGSVPANYRTASDQQRLVCQYASF